MPIHPSGSPTILSYSRSTVSSRNWFMFRERDRFRRCWGAAQVGGAATVSAAAQGAEVVILGTMFTRLNFAVHASPQIKEIGDLRGKTIGTGSIGGNTYFAALLFLHHFSWVANRDVNLIE